MKRKAKKFGNGAHVIVPVELAEKDVYIVSGEKITELEELIEKTLILRKLDSFTKKEFHKEYEDFKREIKARLTALEVVYQKPHLD